MIPSIPTLSPHVSVNRVQIVDLPGLPMDAEVRGQNAYHLVSNHAITRYARERASPWPVSRPRGFFPKFKVSR